MITKPTGINSIGILGATCPSIKYIRESACCISGNRFSHVIEVQEIPFLAIFIHEDHGLLMAHMVLDKNVQQFFLRQAIP